MHNPLRIPSVSTFITVGEESRHTPADPGLVPMDCIYIDAIHTHHPKAGREPGPGDAAGLGDAFSFPRHLPFTPAVGRKTGSPAENPTHETRKPGQGNAVGRISGSRAGNSTHRAWCRRHGNPHGVNTKVLWTQE